MGICASQEEQEAAEYAAWLAGGKEICINCRISAFEFDEKIEVSLNEAKDGLTFNQDSLASKASH